MAERRRIAELSDIELTGTESVQLWVRTARDQLRDLSVEIDLTATELRGTLERSGGTLLDRFAARAKARKVTRRLFRARMLTQGAAVEVARFWGLYRAEYEPLIQPSRNSGRAWRWEN
jgi:hypothetical protein